MPELPDVELFKRYIDATSLHQRITSVTVTDDRILDGISERALQSRLHEKEFASSSRHGKYLFLELDDETHLFLHFGMTGFVKYCREKQKDPHHTRVIIDFDNGFHLAFSNQRLLGKLGLVETVGDFLREKNIGPDASEVDYSRFQSIMAQGKGSVKSTLMNQSSLAGIGNIYADEILYQSGIHPRRRTNQLSDEEMNNIYQNMDAVLETAVASKANPDEMPRSYLLKHREEGVQCTRCGGSIEKTTVSGRTTYFCPGCQK